MANEQEKTSLKAWVAVIGGLFGCFMAGMNVHVTSAALPEIEGSLGATFEEGSWISTAYLVAEIVMIPLTAWLVEVFSLRRVMLVGSSVFLVASVACSFSPNLTSMIMIRVVQGAAGAVLIPLSFQLIITELPASRVAMGMALFSLSNSVAQAAGPSIGGWLTDVYSWRWIFYLQLIPGVLLLAAIAWAISPQAMQLQRLRQGDWLGIASMIVGLGAIQIVLEEGGRKDWFGSDFIVWTLVLGVAALLLFIYTQLFGRRSFINLRLLAGYNFGVASAAMFIFGGATFGLVFLVPNYLSQLHGYNAREIGVSLIAYGLVQLLLAPVMPRLMRWLPAKLMVATGFAIMAAGCYIGAYLDADSAANVIIPSTVVRGIGQPFIMVALSVLAVSGLSKSEAGSASALFSMLRNLGGAVGTAVLTQVVSQRERFHSVRIGEQVNAFSPGLQERLQADLGQGSDFAINEWLPAQAETLTRLGTHIRHESFLMAYGDAFYLSFIALLVCAAAALALRSGKSAG
ncbi:TPA: DHA2 family efflux MFS transporter permease subunit [Pseudomonas aeruginosa]|uniref:DHA2 family efflux MFS transporter permease subunit n=3 Tax=Pseudomonas aeruginosa group TaxID=136841 RepID=A0ABD7K537_PSEAI|nr:MULTISPECIES: MDR family MFS transporter [Pseudomonas aeruginosa group]ABR81338.1 drug resistance transporter, EmrB/QacA family [Pseudomonas aeruginosa PA7]AYZ85839.1 DHA2 family efflux MFS transporter permease subunit [Pseudomonas aeruginosa]EKS2404883.1 multidrug efflux MFS transporter [Pseudomonas aeruginosa]EKW2495621.1 multidrug efflux MFS transporter [Pseudomonas aeruginosa]EKW4463051.1 multidrug efflux MFS transporter [Pseudomonas aeruginosa]